MKLSVYFYRMNEIDRKVLIGQTQKAWLSRRTKEENNEAKLFCLCARSISIARARLIGPPRRWGIETSSPRGQPVSSPCVSVCVSCGGRKQSANWYRPITFPSAVPFLSSLHVYWMATFFSEKSASLINNFGANEFLEMNTQRSKRGAELPVFNKSAVTHSWNIGWLKLF